MKCFLFFLTLVIITLACATFGFGTKERAECLQWKSLHVQRTMMWRIDQCKHYGIDIIDHTK